MREPIKTGEAEPEASDWRMRSVVDRAHDAFVAMDAGGFIVDWNPAAERILGWSREEAVGKVLADLIVPVHLREAHWQGLQRFLRTGEGPVLEKRIELTALRRGDRQFPVELTISVEPTRNGPRFFAFLHDISERRFSEQLLRAQAAVAQVFAEAHRIDEAMDRLLAASVRRWTGESAHGGRPLTPATRFDAGPSGAARATSLRSSRC